MERRGLIVKYDEGIVADIERVYGSWTPRVIESITMPPPRYYLRVNRLAIHPSDFLEALNQKGIQVYADEYFSEAVWIPIESNPSPKWKPECLVYVDRYAAESVMLGADLYFPGIVGVEECVKKGKEVGIAYRNNENRLAIVALGIALFNYDDYGRRKRGIAVRNIESLFRLPSLRGLPEYNWGFFYEQSLPSITVVHVLDPEPGTVIVDMCAAPGGKTSHLYEYVGGSARIYAFDHSKKKVAKMKETLARLRHRGVSVIKADSRYLHRDFPFLRADYVLLDPPCSSLGVVPKIDDYKRYEDVISLANYQRQFLRAASKLLKPGGILVYSTCTITYIENENNIIYAVEELGFELEDAYPFRGARSPKLSSAQRFTPGVHGYGYFIARLRKTRAG